MLCNERSYVIGSNSIYLDLSVGLIYSIGKCIYTVKSYFKNSVFNNSMEQNVLENYKAKCCSMVIVNKSRGQHTWSVNKQLLGQHNHYVFNMVYCFIWPPQWLSERAFARNGDCGVRIPAATDLCRKKQVVTDPLPTLGYSFINSRIGSKTSRLTVGVAR